MKVLIACESSGTVREAFLKRGHEAWSNDLLPADDGSEHHIQGCATEAITVKDWDLIIMHPPCTHLCVSGNRHYGKGKPKHNMRIEAIDWTMRLFELAKQHAAHVAMENPVGVLPIKATQYIQPYEFGHPESKKTGLWLHNLPKLTPTNDVKAEFEKLPAKDRHRIWYASPSADRWKIRSKTFQGIADAMADQWGVKK